MNTNYNTAYGQLIKAEAYAFDLKKDFYDFNAFGKWVKDYKIIGLGEDTHGIKDFYLLKKELIEYLVKNYGFNTVVVEDNS